MTQQLSIAGVLLLVLAAMHAFFPRYFKWQAELSTVSLLTRQIFFVHHFFVAITVGLMGFISCARSDQLANTPLGREICVGFGIFWFVRLVCQFFVYSPQLWRGKWFETAVHVMFSLLWVYLTAVYLLVGFTVS